MSYVKVTSPTMARLTAASLLIASCGATHALDLLESRQAGPGLVDAKLNTNSIYVGSRSTRRAGTVDNPWPVARVQSACVCTNLSGVSVICPDCDNASDDAVCFQHDRQCQDAALKGGIREHQTFFCTTQTD